MGGRSRGIVLCETRSHQCRQECCEQRLDNVRLHASGDESVVTCLGTCCVYFGILEDQEKIHTVMKTYPYPGLPGSPRPAWISASLQSFSSCSNWSVLATRSSCKNRVARAGLKSVHACSVWVTTKSLITRLVLVKLLTRDDAFPNFSRVGWVAILRCSIHRS